jgi:hypothetical protein
LAGAIAVVFPQAPDQIAYSRREAYSAENQHEVRLCVQVAIKEETQKSSNERATCEKKREFHRERCLSRKSAAISRRRWRLRGHL